MKMAARPLCVRVPQMPIRNKDTLGCRVCVVLFLLVGCEQMDEFLTRIALEAGGGTGVWMRSREITSIRVEGSLLFDCLPSVVVLSGCV